jgi:hypothetical protein
MDCGAGPELSLDVLAEGDTVISGFLKGKLRVTLSPADGRKESRVQVQSGFSGCGAAAFGGTGGTSSIWK